MLNKASKNVFHVGRPNIPNKEKVLEKFSQVLDNQWLTNMGPLSLDLEERIAEMLGVKHCICVCNATIGLELVQRALDLKGEVIIPSFYLHCHGTLAQVAKDRSSFLRCSFRGPFNRHRSN